jgi:hypothetical protein
MPPTAEAPTEVPELGIETKSRVVTDREFQRGLGRAKHGVETNVAASQLSSADKKAIDAQRDVLDGIEVPRVKARELWTPSADPETKAGDMMTRQEMNRQDKKEGLLRKFGQAFVRLFSGERKRK